MTELELLLLELGRELDYPPTPQLGPRVRARLAERPARRWALTRRTLVVALAVLAVAIGAAFAVPPARTAILEWLGLRGVEIRRVEAPPKAPRGGDLKAPIGANLGLGRRVTLSEARQLAEYGVVVPTLEGFNQPPEVYFTASLPGGQVAFVYYVKDPRSPTILLTQFRAEPGFEYIQKLSGPGTLIERVTINGQPGYWLEGEPHAFLFVDPDGKIREETLRLAGNTLLWQRGELTLRLEGARTKAEATRIARSVR